MKSRLSAVLLAAMLFRCSDQGPSSPSPPADTGPPSSAPLPTGGTVFARVTNAVTGAAISGATVTVSGVPVISTSSDGSFRVEVGNGDAVPIVVSAPGYWTRESHLRPVAAAALAIPLDLLPDGDDFDLDFFDHVFRQVGEAGTHRWTNEPEFEIWEGVYDCAALVDAGCEELTATGELAPQPFAASVRRVIEADARKYTDAHVLGTVVSTRTHPAGAVLTRNEFLQRGKVTFALVERPDNFSWAFWRWANNDGSMMAGHVQLNRKHTDSRGVYSHELAHTLGFSHPLGLDQVPLLSIMRRGHGADPTRFDILHGRILYLRPPDSHTPDVDPARFVLNGLRDASGESGGEVTASAP